MTEPDTQFWSADRNVFEKYVTKNTRDDAWSNSSAHRSSCLQKCCLQFHPCSALTPGSKDVSDEMSSVMYMATKDLRERAKLQDWTLSLKTLRLAIVRKMLGF